MNDPAATGPDVTTSHAVAPPPVGRTPSVWHWRDFDPTQLEGASALLATELTTYRDRLDEILAHQGEYVVIGGDRIIGFFADCDAAVRAAWREFGRRPVLIKEVVEFEPIARLGGGAA